MHGRPKGWLGLGLAARSGGETTRITVRDARDGTLVGLLVVAGQRQGAAGELAGATGRASSKAVGVELTRAAARRAGCGGCFGWRCSSAGRELWWPVVMEARAYSVDAEKGR
jgi:hypothetical protein